MVQATDDAVFKALANPFRRKMLDLLSGGPRTTGDLSRSFPALSRFAVMQHLSVLQAAELVLIRKEGRHRFNYLNAVPVQRVYERWVRGFAQSSASNVLAVEKYLEGESSVGVRNVKIENEIRLNATIERVWRAMTVEQLEWYPHTYGRQQVKGLVFEERVGGQCYEDWGDGRGHLYGTITHFDPPNSYSMRGQLADGLTLESWIILKEDNGGTLLQTRTVVFGDISEEMEKGIRFHGDLSAYEEQLRSFVEAEAKVG